MNRGIILSIKQTKNMLSKLRVALALLGLVLLTAETGAAANLKAIDVLSKYGTAILLAIVYAPNETKAIDLRALEEENAIESTGGEIGH